MEIPVKNAKVSEQDQGLLNWMVAYDEICQRKMQSLNAEIGEGASARFCFCTARTLITDMTQDEISDLVKLDKLPHRATETSGQITEQCLAETREDRQ